MDKRIKEKQKQIEHLTWEIHKIIKEHYPDFNDCFDTIDNFWDCPDSPFGRCVYHTSKDKGNDCCVFCGEPQERK